MVVEMFKQTLGTEEESVIKKLEKWARERGDKTFIYYGEENRSITYKTFNELANSFAHNLIDKGIQKGDRISLFLKNSYITTIAMFGIWKAGAVYCPINFNYMGNLLSYQINDTEPKMLITERQMVPIINDIKDRLTPITIVLHDPKECEHDYQDEVNIKLDGKFPSLLFQDFIVGNNDNPNIDLHFYDIANIIYTSGTTGPSKGVVQSYRCLHSYTYLVRAFNNQEDVLYNDLPMYHVGAAFANVVNAAFVGCTVAMWDKFSPSNFWKRIEISGATNAILVDVMIHWLMKEAPTENDRNNTLKKVQLQPLPEYHNDFAKRFGIHFVETEYGQTETGGGCHVIIDELGEEQGTPIEMYKGYTREEVAEIAKNLNLSFPKGNIKFPKGFVGGSTPFMEVAILNEHDEECDIGESGQFAYRPLFPHIMMKEYYNKPAATTEAFQNLWFHSGDVGYKDENGFYYFVDRMKNLIRHKGENISSYQIESLINQHDLVDICAAFPIPAEEGDADDIVVFVVPKTDELSEAALGEWTKREMPKYMWPKHIRIVPDLPKTPTNKIEKYKLRALILEEFQKVNI
ncbi:class I adenylate-forming enzyme family protein [Bacillus sp. FJAT-29814]|uniref:class I adenylate-forming enzyme family protein n=1 Tax=Bacillus sp. FJAT-29814 TaxID=1729688 RepID=UPI000AC2A847|nr:AMP-binding protein [Bacillus sp. FJAT-29814]